MQIKEPETELNVNNIDYDNNLNHHRGGSFLMPGSVEQILLYAGIFWCMMKCVVIKELLCKEFYTMINDSKILKAINTISLRSERQTEEKKLVESFVDIGILNVLVNNNHQIIFGRRGTGKTHVLKVLGNAMLDGSTKIVYLDCRTLGSASSVVDDTVPPIVRCIHLFKDFLNQVHLTILDTLFEDDTPLNNSDSEKALNLLEELLDSYSEYEKKILKATERHTCSSDVKNGIGVDAEVSQKGAMFKASYTSQEGKALESESYQEYATKETLVFPNLSVGFNKLLDSMKLDLIILIDEWVSIPKMLQPIFSEFLKRSLLVCNRITVKIASIEYHSLFMKDTEGGQRLGLEVGSDVSDAISLDDFYVFDLNKDYVVGYFKDVLYKHLTAELPEGYLLEAYNIDSSDRLISKMFTQKDVFEELVRACEGVTRDFINILSKAILKTKQKDGSKVDKKTVMNVAGEWFEKDKHPHLNDNSQSILSDIISDVIGKKKARCFMVAQKLSSHSALQSLYDFRVIHLIHKGYSSKDQPGERYNIFILDYGTYVEMIRTQQWSQQTSMFIDGFNDIDTVPYDDKRSIRRIILQEEILNKHI